MPSVATVQKETFSQRIRRTLEAVPCIGIFLGIVFSLFESQVNAVRKRKSTYKLALYFRYQMWMAIFGAALFLYLFLAQFAGLTGLLTPALGCPTKTAVTLNTINEKQSLYDVNGFPDSAVFMAFTHQERSSVACAGDALQDHIQAICSRSQMSALAGLMLAIGILYLVVTAACLFISVGYSFFSNMPSGSITTDASDCRITCLGAIAKQGPKLLRLANAGAFICLITIIILVEGRHLCKGDLAMTHKCLMFHDDCAFNQVKNCIYYFSQTCRDVGIPDPGLTYKEAYKKCTQPKHFQRFSGRFDVRVVHKHDCTRCWLLHYDCLDTAVDLVKVVRNSDPEFFADSSLTLAPYYGDTSTTERGNLLKLLKCQCGTSESSKTLIANSGAVQQLNCESAPPPATQICNIDVDPPYATMVAGLSIKEDDDPYASERSDRTFSLATKQFCSWSPAFPAYFFEDSECEQSGAYVSRIASLGSIVMLFLAALVMIVGGLLRINVQQETWCYDPPKPEENSCWKLVRLTGPG